MFDKIRNIALLTLAGCLLSSVICLTISTHAGVSLFGWEEDGGRETALEGRKYENLPRLEAEDVLDGSFQSSAERYLADSVPMRDDVLLTNAALQRLCIVVANTAFGYDVYPTFFESDILYSRQYHALPKLPMKETANLQARLMDFANAFSRVAERYPETRFAFVIVDHSMTSAANPAQELSASAWTTTQTESSFRASTAELDNVSVVAATYNNPTEFFTDFFRTDHHWNILGASRAYNELASCLDAEPFDPRPLTYFEGKDFSGADARTGLIPLSEETFDTAKSFSDITFVSDDGEKRSGDDHGVFFSGFPRNQWDKFYSVYYMPERENAPDYEWLMGDGSATAILLSDSYGHALKRILATNYGMLLHSLDFHSDTKEKDLRLVKHIEDNHPRDVIIVASTINYSTLLKRMPNYLDVGADS